MELSLCFLSGLLIPIRKALGATLPAERNPPQHINGTAELAHKKLAQAKECGIRGRCWRICHCWQTLWRAQEHRGRGCSKGQISVDTGHVINVQVG